jgi:opacity protein-like surface antigen
VSGTKSSKAKRVGLRRTGVSAAAVAALLACVSVSAAERDEDDGEEQRAPLPRFEVTPFVGYRLGGDFDVDVGADTTQNADLDDHGSFAIAFNVRRDEESQYELFYSRQETNLEPDSPLGPLGINVEYLHIGGTLDVDQDAVLKPYVVGTLGVTRLSPEPGRVSDNTRFSVSLGGGVRVPVSGHFSFRLEARGFLTFVNTDSSFFCSSGSSGGFCAIRGSGSTFVQYELLAGAAFAF